MAAPPGLCRIAAEARSTLKTLIIATVPLPTFALAQQSQQLPQPRQPGQWCKEPGRATAPTQSCFTG
jgi:hypothetical protein